MESTGVRVELTSTRRVALHRYTFPATSKEPRIVVDITNDGQQSSTNPFMNIDPDTGRVTGIHILLRFRAISGTDVIPKVVLSSLLPSVQAGIRSSHALTSRETDSILHLQRSMVPGWGTFLYVLQRICNKFISVSFNTRTVSSNAL